MINHLKMHLIINNNKDWNDGDNPFEQKELSLFISFNERLLEPNDESNFLILEYSTKKYIGYELDSLIRQRILVDQMLTHFIFSNGLIDYFEDDDISELVFALVDKRKGIEIRDILS